MCRLNSGRRGIEEFSLLAKLSFYILPRRRLHYLSVVTLGGHAHAISHTKGVCGSSLSSGCQGFR